jgi:serine phosphatase RsbU (regulator of sigma subunit)
VVLGVAGGLTWIVLLTVVQLDVDGRLFVVPALSLSALVLSLITSWRPTLVVALCGVIAVAILSQHVQGLFTADGIVRTTGSAALGAFAVANSVLRLRRDRRIRTMTEVATIAQAAIMQPVPARVGPLDMASRYVSASADALVGGDLFDVVDTQVGVRIIVGDVRGKGLSSVRIASRALSSFRRVAPHAHVGLIDVALAIEDQLRVLLGDEDFVTVVLCQFHDDGRLEVVNCGHHPPFRLVAGQPPVVLSTIAESLPLGLGATPHADTFRLEPGERLLLFTDGLVEARNSDGVYFDIEAACEELANTETNLDDALDQLVEQVRSHVGGVVNDDLCVLLASQGVEVGTGTEADEVADWGRASRTT